jgi:hypothetical protein
MSSACSAGSSAAVMAPADFVEQREHRLVFHRHVHRKRALEVAPLGGEGHAIAGVEVPLLQPDAGAQRFVRVAHDRERHRLRRLAGRGGGGVRDRVHLGSWVLNCVQGAPIIFVGCRGRGKLHRS